MNKISKKNTILGLDQIKHFIDTDFSMAYQQYKAGIVFYYSVEKMYTRTATILKEHPFDEDLREYIRAYHEDIDIQEEKGEKPHSLYIKDSSGNASYHKLLNVLRDLYHNKYNERIGDFEETFSFATYHKFTYQIAFPENNSDILIATTKSMDRKTSKNNCRIININDDLNFLREDKYKYTNLFTYENVLIIYPDVLEKIMS
jgi:hypothetical protein